MYSPISTPGNSPLDIEALEGFRWALEEVLGAVLEMPSSPLADWAVEQLDEARVLVGKALEDG